MAGGISASGPSKRYKGHTTPFVVLACIVAASGGALFGYDNGITGGVVAMDGFLQRFFPEVLKDSTNLLTKKQAGDPGKQKDPYCTYDDQKLQWFTSSLFIAGVFASIPAGYTTRKLGRKATMLLAGVLFDIGVVLMAAAFNLGMLIGGRVLLGIAVAFASVAVTLYNSEMAPAHMRGRLNQIFQLVLSLGVLVAQWINLGTELLEPWGWRLSLALAGLPAIVLTLGGIFLPETPNSLVERGLEEEGEKVLQNIRGVDDVSEELGDIKAACQQAAHVENPWRTILKPAYRPQLVVALTATFFQQWTGINTVIFYSPQLFISLGKSRHDALIATIVTGIVNHCATYVSLWAADHHGRRALWLEGGIQMFFSLCGIAVILALFGHEPWTAWVVLVLICIYISAYAWSWGPLAWLYPSEIQPLETRSAGQSICTLINLLFSFVIGQTYLSMLCTFKWGIFLFFAGMIFIMTLFAYLFYPETRGLAIEDAPKVFQKHWFWKHYAKHGFHADPDAESATATTSEPLLQNGVPN